MHHLNFERVTKRFGARTALSELSFEVQPGEVFGLLGPNGAGKTTLIRCALDILRPDEGQVRLLGEPVSVSVLRRVAYLPEERGLYRREKLKNLLIYLARLKGVGRAESKRRAAEWLERLHLAHASNWRIERLSKGMSQKLQVAAALISDPELAFLDEPFSGLDPVNAQMVIGFIRERQQRGRTTVLSTHQMAQVEALCDRVALVHRGRRVLYGEVSEVRRAHAHNIVLIRATSELTQDSHPAILSIERPQTANSGPNRLDLSPGTDLGQFLAELIASGVEVTHFEPVHASIEQVFVETVQAAEAQAEADA